MPPKPNETQVSQQQDKNAAGGQVQQPESPKKQSPVKGKDMTSQAAVEATKAINQGTKVDGVDKSDEKGIPKINLGFQKDYMQNMLNNSVKSFAYVSQEGVDEFPKTGRFEVIVSGSERNPSIKREKNEDDPATMDKIKASATGYTCKLTLEATAEKGKYVRDFLKEKEGNHDLHLFTGQQKNVEEGGSKSSDNWALLETYLRQQFDNSLDEDSKKKTSDELKALFDERKVFVYNIVEHKKYISQQQVISSIKGYVLPVGVPVLIAIVVVFLAYYYGLLQRLVAWIRGTSSTTDDEKEDS